MEIVADDDNENYENVNTDYDNDELDPNEIGTIVPEINHYNTE
jgi:hypothetical protein